MIRISDRDRVTSSIPYHPILWETYIATHEMHPHGRRLVMIRGVDAWINGFTWKGVPWPLPAEIAVFWR